MSVKIAVIGDPHVKDDNISETQDLILRLINILTQVKPDLIVFAGDMLHKFDEASVYSHKLSITFLREIKKIANVIFIIGNHDLSSPMSFLTDDHFFTPLYEWSGLAVVDRVCSIFELKGFKFAAVPYVTEGRFEEALHSNQNYSHDTVHAIFAHQQFLGCKMDKVISKTGDKWSSEKPLVISGHIHEHQQLAENLIYVGTPRQSSFRDSTDKTISVFEFSNEKSEVTGNQLSGISNGVHWIEKRISVGLPIKVKINIRADQVPTWVPPEGHKIKLEITGSFAEIAAVREHANYKYWKSIGIVITENTIADYIPSSGYIDPPPHFTSFTTMYKRKIQDNPEYVSLYKEIIDGITNEVSLV